MGVVKYLDIVPDLPTLSQGEILKNYNEANRAKREFS